MFADVPKCNSALINFTNIIFHDLFVIIEVLQMRSDIYVGVFCKKVINGF